MKGKKTKRVKFDTEDGPVSFRVNKKEPVNLDTPAKDLVLRAFNGVKGYVESPPARLGYPVVRSIRSFPRITPKRPRLQK